MAWSWSHTNEAYMNARENLGRFGKKRLQEMWAEWQAAEEEGTFHPKLNEAKYVAAIKKAKTIPKENLADDIWDSMNGQATCTNGGWEAWGCPFGCHPHLVSFSTWKEQMDQAKELKARRI